MTQAVGKSRAFDAYRGLGGALNTYWTDYGGLPDLLRSPLFHLSLMISACSYRVWLSNSWQDIPLSVLPNLLGFSLGAYALIFSLAGEGLLLALSQPSKTEGRPLLNMINATFLHFLMVQTVAIVYALAQKGTLVVDVIRLSFPKSQLAERACALLSAVAGAFGYWMTIYAVLLLVGAGLAVYRLANMSGSAARTAHAARQEKERDASRG